MDDKLKEIGQRIDLGFVTEDDIQYLFDKAKMLAQLEESAARVFGKLS